MTNPELLEALTRISARHFGIETLITRGMDSLDFHDVSVSSIEAALREAYLAGQAGLELKDVKKP
ncbi:MAG: hypothetical protein RIT15_593 [Pseudomonadota bacterium]|jgi:hypothetical protein